MRIVLTNYGTFGDINPLIGLAVELRARGHRVVMATPEMFRAKIEPLGIGFMPVRPDQDPNDARLAAMIYDIKKGTERGLREFLFPSIRESYQDLLAAVLGNEGGAEGRADLLVTGELAYAGPIVAEVAKVPWASYVLAPFSFFSAYDPPVLPPYPLLAEVQARVPGMGHVVARFARWVTRDWPRPVYELRRELGLKPGRSPIFDAKFSPQLVLALFSPVLGSPQPDWPPNTRVTGFVSYDGDAGKMEMSAELEAFLAAGPPPIVFSLGTAAVFTAGDFFEQSARAAESLNRRAVLLVGHDPRNVPANLPDTIFPATYAPYSELFRRASVVVHQGGVGGTGRALAAGKPMLVVPYSHDQPDNARRMVRAGVARSLRRAVYAAASAASDLDLLLTDPGYAERAAALGAQVAGEDGVRNACDALEAMTALVAREND